MKQEDRFLEVLDGHKNILFKVAGLYCKQAEDKKDLVQEMIFQLWKSFERYDDQYKYSTWIYRIALNVAISFYRKETNRQKLSGPLSGDIFSISDKYEHEEKELKFQLLEKFIALLKEMDKALMILYLEEKSHKEIAEIIGISESNVGTKINRIKNTFIQKNSSTKNLQ